MSNKLARLLGRRPRRLTPTPLPSTQAPAGDSPALASSPTASSPEARARFVAGVCGPDTAPFGDSEVRSYVAGGLAEYLAELGLKDAEGRPHAFGAIAAVKIRDEAGDWRRGRSPEVAKTVRLFLREAKALGFRTVASYVPAGAWEPEPFGAALPAGRGRLLEAARQLARRLSDEVDGWLLWNELEALLGKGASSRDWCGAWSAEALLAPIWNEYGAAWIAGGDMSASHLVDSMPARVAAWDAVRGGLRPEAIAAHLYGEGGDQPEHLEPLLRALEHKLGYRPHLILTEWALGFEGVKVKRGSKPILRLEPAGLYAGAMGNALAALEVQGAYFTVRELDEPDEWALEGLKWALEGLKWALAGDVREPAPILNPAKAMAKGMRLEREARER